MSTPSRRPGHPRGGARRFLRDLAIIIVAALVVSFLVRTFVVRSFYIPSGSMEDTLQINDRVVVDEFVPRFAGVQRGDVVVFDDPGGWLGASGDNDLIKRVIGLPGDHVSCCDAEGRLEVNGVGIDEPYIALPPGQTRAALQDFSVTVPTGHLWVMGDNRDNSGDSRFHGTVPIHDVVGRAIVISWPASRWRWLDRHAATFVSVPDPR